MRRVLCLLLAVMSLVCFTAPAMGESSAEQYEKAMELLKENKYTEAGQVFAALGSYSDSPRYTMYCSAIAAGEAGFYAIAAENLNSLNGFLDSNLLAVYYTGLSLEAAGDYKQAGEVLGGITLYRDVASRLAGYPALIEARDAAAAEQARADAYAAADRAEQDGDYAAAYTGFSELGDYQDSALRVSALQAKIGERDAAAEEQARADAYAAADRAEQDGDYATAYTGFSKLGDYKDSALRAAAVENQGKYAQAMQYAMSGNYSSAYSLFDALGDYEDSALKAYILSVTEFATVENRGNGIAAFKFHDAWGLLNVTDGVILSPVWDSIGPFNSLGLATVAKDQKYGYINTKGDLVIDCKWDEVSAFSGSLCTVRRNGSFGLVDAQGRTVSNAQWQTLGDSYSYINWGSSYYTISAPSFSDGIIKVQNNNGKWGFIDMDGNQIGQVVWDEIQDFSEGFAAVSQNKQYGFIDKDGQTVIQPQYTAVRSFHEGLAAVQDDENWKYINPKNEVVIPALYAQALDFSDGKADVFLPGTGWQIIDNAGTLVYFTNPQNIIDYNRAVKLEEAGELEQAFALFSSMNYKDSAERARKVSYALGTIKRDAQDWEGAVEAFAKAGAYSDAAAQVLFTRYAEGEAKRNAQDWDGAEKAFEQAGSYRDAATQITETRYQQAAALNKAGKYAEAYAIYVAIVGYKDVVSIMRTDDNIAAAAVAAALEAELAVYKTAGNYVTFGAYPQTESGTDSTPIEWLVLDYDAANNRALLISRYGLDAKSYNRDDRTVTWEDCTLRSWLNGEFYNKAFSAADQSAILLTDVDNSVSQGYSEWNISGGNSTQDRIFLLSCAEATTYFGEMNKNNIKVRVAPTAYAIRQGADTSGSKTAEGAAAGWWWLRSPGYSLFYAADAYSDGSLDYYDVGITSGSVRPAFWLDLNAGIF